MTHCKVLTSYLDNVNSLNKANFSFDSKVCYQITTVNVQVSKPL